LIRSTKILISGSGVLNHIQEHLNGLYKTIGGDRGKCLYYTHYTPPKRPQKGMDVNYSTKGAQSFPLARHGMAHEVLLQY
jgi:putative ATP-dependent endonuclease of OLD family